MKNRLGRIIFFSIVLLAAFLRLYRLTSVPPSISWDEAAVGYNAFTISHWGKDEWGKIFPLVFKSFEDYKHPVHIYLTSVAVAVLGLNDFAVRLPSALFGVGNVILIYFLAQKIFRNKYLGLISSFILAISPYNLQFSRFNHELNFVIFFFMLGVLLFFEGIEGKKKLLPFSFLSFGICLYSYHSSKIVAFPLIILLVILYFKNLIQIKRHFFLGLFVFGIFLLGIMFNPELLGLARIKQTSFQNSSLTERIVIIGKQYLWHFSPKYLFLTGDKNARHSTGVVGEFYKSDSLFLLLGTLLLIGGVIKKKKEYLFLLAWALLAPLPSAMVNEAPHAARAMFMLVSWHLLIAFGIFKFLSLFKKRYLWIMPLLIILFLYGFEFTRYAKYYFGEYPVRYAIDWQYGMKEVVRVAKGDNFYSVFVTDARSQPYIFFLYYLKTPLPEFFETVEYNSTISRSYNLVTSFGKYQFADWDPVGTFPDDTVLYAVTPSQYSGLMYKNYFNRADVVKLPNGSDAFYLVSGKKELKY